MKISVNKLRLILFVLTMLDIIIAIPWVIIDYPLAEYHDFYTEFYQMYLKIEIFVVDKILRFPILHYLFHFRVASPNNPMLINYLIGFGFGVWYSIFLTVQNIRFTVKVEKRNNIKIILIIIFIFLGFLDFYGAADCWIYSMRG